MKKSLSTGICAMGGMFLATGCYTERTNDPAAMAVLSAASDSVVGGTVNFIRVKQGLRMEGNFSGLSPGLHGFHIHEKGDCSAKDATSAGGHFNPTHQSHAGPMEPNRHLGDLGNLEADAAGNATYSRTIPDLSLDGENSIVGKSVIIHAKADDFKTQPSGGSGDRVACGIIVRQ